MPQLENRLKSKAAVIGIMGLGYVGLPLAVAFAEANLRVIGFDMQDEKVASVNRGESYISDISNAKLHSAVASGFLRATSDQNELKNADAICLCVPTPLTDARKPDLSFVTKVAGELSSKIRAGQLVVLESTTYPGTTRDIVQPILERSGLKGGVDFHLAYSPERIDPGNATYNVTNTPKIVGGIDATCTELARLLYSQICESVVTTSCPEVAEMTKLVENVFRNVNIALVNELAQLCEKMGISIWEVLDATATKPFGYMPFHPGPGVGGHCIPLDPHYLSHKAREYNFKTRFIELATAVNDAMPGHVAQRITEALDERGKRIKGAQILVLGVAYKKDAAECRESPAIKLIELLRSNGVEVVYNDNFVTKITVFDTVLESVELSPDRIKSADCVVISTNHSYYDYQFIVDNALLIFDARGATRDCIGNDNILRLGESGNGFTREFQQMIKDTKAWEDKDKYARGHTERVTGYAVSIAKKMGLLNEYTEKIKLASQVHDIGKIGIPGSILLKPGKLTPEEYDRVKSHSVKGEHILAPVVEDKEILIMVRHHHERYDGKGYPDGVDAKDISIGAKIITLADTYDAITSDRPYRKALKKAAAYSEIKKNSGTQFDPQVSDIFLNMLRDESVYTKISRSDN